MAIGAFRVGESRIDQLVKRVARSGRNVEVAESLRLLMFVTLGGELCVRGSEQGILFAGVQFYRPVFIRAGSRTPRANVADVELLRLPGLEALFEELLGEALGISGSAKGFLSKEAGGLVMSVSITGGAGKTRDEHIGAKRPNHVDDVGKGNLVASPLFEGFLCGFRVAEVGDAAETLIYAVIAAGGEKFECAQDAQLIRESVAGFILAALAAGQRHQEAFDTFAARFERKQTAVFIVRMGDHNHEAAGVVQPAHLLLQPGGAGVGRERIEKAGCICGRSGRRLAETSQESDNEKSGDSQDFVRPDTRVCDVHIYETACSRSGEEN